MIKVDECPDENGNWTIRTADGTENGDTDTCLATVYDLRFAEQIVSAINYLWYNGEGSKKWYNEPISRSKCK